MASHRHPAERGDPRRGEPERAAGGRASVEADTVVVATGFRPDLDMLREIRLTLDEVVEAPAKLAPLIDPNLALLQDRPAPRR